MTLRVRPRAEGGIPELSDHLVQIIEGLADPAAHERVYGDRYPVLQCQANRDDLPANLASKAGGGARPPSADDF